MLVNFRVLTIPSIGKKEELKAGVRRKPPGDSAGKSWSLLRGKGSIGAVSGGGGVVGHDPEMIRGVCS